MSNLQKSRDDLVDLDLQLRKWIEVFPLFESNVMNIQRRTVRRWVCEYIDKLKSNITSALSKARARYTGEQLGSLGTDLLSAYPGTNLRPEKGDVILRPMIMLSPEGEFSITRSQVQKGIPINEADFIVCLETIRNHVNEDPIDTNTSPETLVKSYLREVYKNKSSTLPTFGKTA